SERRGESPCIFLKEFSFRSVLNRPVSSGGASGGEPKGEAGAAPAGGLTNRLGRSSVTMGRGKSKRPRWSAERRVSRSQGARGRLASVLRRGSHPRQGAARTRTERLFGAPLPLWREQEEESAGPRASRPEAAKRAAQRWLFDNVKNVLPKPAWSEAECGNRPIGGSSSVEGQ